MFRQLATGLIGLLLTSFQAAYGQANFELVSLTNAGQPPADTPAGSSYQAAVTPDGRYVVFEGSFTGLVTSPVASGSQIYLRDRTNHTTELISQNSNGEAADKPNSRPTISNDGCRVAFISDASNLDSRFLQNYGNSNVYVRNRCTNPKTTTMVDIGNDSIQGATYTREARISGDGSTVVFATDSALTVLGGTKCTSGAVYLRHLNNNTTTALMRNGSCITGREPDISSDGTRIAFWSYSDYLATNVSPWIWQIYLYDTAIGSTSLSVVSASANGALQLQDDGVSSGGGSTSQIYPPAISQDGRFVAFQSPAYGLWPIPSWSGISHIYVKDTYTGYIHVASVSTSNEIGNNHSGTGVRPGISSDGQYVAFGTLATNLVAAGSANFVMRNIIFGGTTGFTYMRFGSDIPDLSPSGRFLTIYSGDPMDINFNSRGWFLIDLGIPYKPTITKLTPMGKKMKVDFTPSAVPGANPGIPAIAATNYGALCEEKDGSYGWVTATSSPITVTGLKPGLTYVCAVAAANTKGASAFSNMVTKKLNVDLTPILMLLLD
jgi:Tol biopolymer transport system component